jgi:uroporphyrinogen decarboxylase
MRRCIRAGAEVVVFGDDYADKSGPVMSPKHFREFIFPAIKKVVKAAKEDGAYVIKHTDGNIDCGDLLCFGTPQQVREKVRWTIKAAGYNGGFILASSNSIPSSVKPENYLAMCEACREFGAYPLQI